MAVSAIHLDHLSHSLPKSGAIPIVSVGFRLHYLVVAGQRSFWE